MAKALSDTRTPVDDFLDWERRQDERYEYLDGRIWAMVGGTIDHATIGSNMLGMLHARLRGTPCRALKESLKVRVGSNVFYPDVLIVCGRLVGKDDVVDNPVVVVEVLSPSTTDLDHGRKWMAYRQIPELRHYVLVSRDEPRIEVYRREDDSWRFDEVVGLDATLRLARPAALELPLAEIYERTSVSD
jgi:Uma2 family endonuclease